MTYRIYPSHADLLYGPVVLEWPYSSGSARVPGRRTKGLAEEIGRSYYNPSITRAAGHRQHSRKHVCTLASDTDEVPSRTVEEARSCMELREPPGEPESGCIPTRGHGEFVGRLRGIVMARATIGHVVGMVVRGIFVAP